MATEMAMLNVRMERSEKDAGCAALAEMGVSPSQYVRAMWRRLAGDRQQARAQIEAVMAPERTPEKQAEIDRRVAAVLRGQNTLLDFAKKMGLDPATHVPMTDEEFEEARYEYLNEKYGA